MSTANQKFVLAAVGTDHHPFDRFVDWIDTWQRHNDECEVFIQRGSTSLVPKSASAPFLERNELDEMIRRADAIVCHGGPSTIMEARNAGVLPVVIPRDPALGEHVDEHQLRFTEFMAAKGVVLSARSQQELADGLALVVQGDIDDVAPGSPTETLDQISVVLDRLMAQPRRSWLPLRKRAA